MDYKSKWIELNQNTGKCMIDIIRLNIVTLNKWANNSENKNYSNNLLLSKKPTEVLQGQLDLINRINLEIIEYMQKVWNILSNSLFSTNTKITDIILRSDKENHLNASKR